MACGCFDEAIQRLPGKVVTRRWDWASCRRHDRIAAVERRSLGQRVGNVAPHRDEIVFALDLLFTAY
jgi:hypothetical protein